MTQSIRILKDCMTGDFPVAILGGGPSLPESLKRLPENCFMIAINRRPLQLTPVSLVVSTDRTEGVWLNEHLTRIPHISARADLSLYDIGGSEGKINYVGYSATLGASIAFYMGAKEIILVGIDLYRGLPYFDSKQGDIHNSQKKSTKHLIKDWEKFRERSPGINLKVINSPLDVIFEEYECPL